MRKIAKIYLAICWAFFVFTLISEPMPEPKFYEFSFYDKGAHLILFGIFAYLLIRAGLDFKKVKFFIIALIGFTISSLFTIFCEYYQSFVPGRQLSEIDLIAGNIGVGIAIVFSYVMAYKIKPKLLLHICCAGCGAYVSKLLDKDYKVILYFYNPNIYPSSEYKKRLREVKNLARKFRLKLIVGGYNHDNWLKKIKGHEKDKERGERCKICYQDRLESAIEAAMKKKFNFFTTTLTISPHKDAQAISEIGKELENKYSVNPLAGVQGIRFLDKDFKKQDGFEKSVKLSKELGLYRQDYCGCEYSKIKDKKYKCKNKNIKKLR